MQKEYDDAVTYSDYDNDIKPEEYGKYQQQSMKDMTVEDFTILDHSYSNGEDRYGSNYEKYTEAKIKGDDLNWAQKKLEQVVDEHSVEIESGKSVFRKTSEEEIKALTGKSLEEFDNNASIDERTAVIRKCTSFGTALQNDSFVTSNVIIEYKTKSGAKAFFTSTGKGVYNAETLQRREWYHSEDFRRVNDCTRVVVEVGD